MNEIKPKVRIGCDYRPNHFERRAEGVYSALRPSMSGDAELLQRALLAKRTPLTQRLATRFTRMFGA